jgi:hypothetical protein
MPPPSFCGAVAGWGAGVGLDEMGVMGAMGALVASVAAPPPQPTAEISMAALLNTTIAVRALDII